MPKIDWNTLSKKKKKDFRQREEDIKAFYADEAGENALTRLAFNKETPPEILNTLVYTEAMDIRYLVLENPSVDPQILMKFLKEAVKSFEDNVRSQDVLTSIAMNPALTPSMCYVLVKVNDRFVDDLLAYNQATPLGVLYRVLPRLIGDESSYSKSVAVENALKNIIRLLRLEFPDVYKDYPDEWLEEVAYMKAAELKDAG